MSEIALYNLLRKIPDATDDEAKEAIADIASSKEVATKADLKTSLAELEIRLIKQIYAVAGIIIAAVGLMIKFL